MEPAGRRELRVFGVGVGALLALAGALAVGGLWPFSAAHPSAGGAALGLGGALAGIGALRPALLRRPHAVWMRGARALAWLNTRLLLGLVYWGMLWPMGVVRRYVADPLSLRPSSAESYWTPRREARDRESYRRQV
jgi:hypothetical protein